MTDNWTKLKNLYVSDHLSKGDLATPQRRLDAIEAIEKILQQYLPQFIKQQKFLKKIPKDEFMQMVRDKKGAKLSGADKSVINGLYKFLPEL